MSVDLSKATALSDQYGNITQLELGGRVIWMLNTGSDKVILQVEKITSDTYAGETTYTAEEFILLDIYPKTNGTVTVTYGGLTKTITDTSGAAEPNAQQVFFGTLNGVSDSVATPASGELTIEGDYSTFACGTYQNGSKTTNIGYCNCITGVSDWGGITSIVNNAFYDCSKLLLTELPEGITSIGTNAFYMKNFQFPAMHLKTLTLPSTLESIGMTAFVYSSGASTMCYIKEFVMLSKVPPTLGLSAFGLYATYYDENGGNNKGVSFVVPKGCGEAYRTEESWITNGVDDYITAEQIVEAS